MRQGIGTGTETHLKLLTTMSDSSAARHSGRKGLIVSSADLASTDRGSVILVFSSNDTDRRRLSHEQFIQIEVVKTNETRWTLQPPITAESICLNTA